jgi:hypothetical protein
MFSGCGESGPPMGTVTGTVTLDDKPMPNLMVVFVPKAGGQTSTATTNSEGKYELLGANSKGALVGLHTVSITTVREAAAPGPDFSNIPSDSADYAKQGDPSQYAKAAQWKELIPEKYNAKTELVEEVKAGANTIDLILKSK